MTTRMQKPRDVVGGALVFAIGAAFFLLGRELDFGNAFRMGPGYFPTVLSVVMMLLGVAMIVLALRGPREPGTFDHVAWRGLVLTIGATVFFGLALRGFGLLPTLLVAVCAAAWGSRNATWRGSILLAIGLAAFCAFLFVYALGLPLPIVGKWLTQFWAAAPAPVR